MKSDDLIDTLCVPENNIPSGRKRPLSQKTKIRVMTDITLTSDLQGQKNEIEAKEKKKRKREPQSTATVSKKS